MLVSKIKYEFYKSPLHDLTGCKTGEINASVISNAISPINESLRDSFEVKFDCNREHFNVFFQIVSIDARHIVFNGIHNSALQLNDIYKCINVVLQQFTNLKCKERRTYEISLFELAENLYGVGNLKDIPPEATSKKDLNLRKRFRFLSNCISSLDISYKWNTKLGFNNFRHAANQIIDDHEFNVLFFRLFLEMCSHEWVFKPIFLKLGNSYDPDIGNLYDQYYLNACRKYITYLQAVAYKSGYVRNGNIISINKIPRSICKQPEKASRYISEIFQAAEGGTLFINIDRDLQGKTYDQCYLSTWKLILKLSEQYRWNTLIIFGARVDRIVHNRPTVYTNDIENHFYPEVIRNDYSPINIFPSRMNWNNFKISNRHRAKRKRYITTRSKKTIWKYLKVETYDWHDLSDNGYEICHLFHTNNNHKWRELDESLITQNRR